MASQNSDGSRAPVLESKSGAPGRGWHRVLYVQVLAAVALGILVGWRYPEFGIKLKPLCDLFIKLVKMTIAPIIFCTIVHGLASVGDIKKLGRVGIKTLIYFEVVSTFALIIGLVVVNLWRPGAGLNVDVATLDANVASGFAAKAHDLTVSGFILNLVPETLFGAFVNGDLLQVLVISALVAFAVSALGPRRVKVLGGVEIALDMLFAIMKVIIKLAPLGAFGAMAFTVGSLGPGVLRHLAALLAGFYTTALLFVLIVLGGIARAAGFSIIRFLVYLREELLLVLGTSSSETALPGLIRKTTNLGCARSTVGLVIPAGYSFNLDGTNIYIAMATVFLAQATNTPLRLGDQLLLLLVAMISSKGASGVTGAGFVTLAATLALLPKVPVASLALLLGIDRFMSECRSLTNLIGNGVATLVISRWEGEVTAGELCKRMAAAPGPLEAPAPDAAESVRI